MSERVSTRIREFEFRREFAIARFITTWPAGVMTEKHTLLNTTVPHE